MSVQRWTTTLSEARYRMDDGPFVLYTDHARIVAEMEQAHAAALEVAHERGMRTTGHYRVAHEQGKADERAAIRARVEAAGHRPFGVYDECECPEDVREQDGHLIELECVSGCAESLLYLVCRSCCAENDYHSEACANGHDHGPDKPYCTAIAAIDGEAGR